MYDAELNQYHDMVEKSEAAFVEKYKHEISHNEYINNIIEAIDQNTPLEGLGSMEIEDLLTLEVDEFKSMLNKWLLDDYLPPMNEAQWSNILKALAE